jgi:malate dehydrogenase (oxaloacetate-decarboxylating)
LKIGGDMDFLIRRDQSTQERIMAVRVRGRSLLINSQTNKGTAFTMEERRELGLEGLLPPRVCTITEQMRRAHEAFLAKPSRLEQYIYLAALQDRNETLFFRLLHEHIDEMMPIVYTPTVGEACQQFSHIYRRARGMYVSYDQRNDIERVLRNVPVGQVSVIVATDGERILGLGDQGAGGMGIPIGKLCLYTLCAGVLPYGTLPVMLDVGTDNEERLGDPLYLGLRQRRIRGTAYQEFVDRFVAATMRVFPNAVLQWEDFLKGNALHQLARFRDRLCTFNDDIQGTAAVVLSGLIAAGRITGQRLKDQRVLLAGAGASAQGIANLFVAATEADGLSSDEARRRIWCVDSRGLVVRDRPGLEAFKARYARDPSEVVDYARAGDGHVTLVEVIRRTRPTVLLGVSGVRNLFDESVVRAMAQTTERPIVFALSNPTSKSECTPMDALRWSEGRAIVATGSPFEPVEFDSRRYRIGQSNNAYIFPGVGLGATVGAVTRRTDGVFLEAARALASQVTRDDLAEGAVFPALRRIRECSHAVACAVIRKAADEGLADSSVLPDLEGTVLRSMWTPEYLPVRYVP